MTAENHRALAMDAIKGIKTWQDCWPVWEIELSNLSGNFSDAKKVHELGNHLR